MSSYTVTVVPTDEPLAPGDVLFEGSRGVGNVVGLLIRAGTWSRYNHVGVVLEPHAGGYLTAEAYGDTRGAAVRHRPGRHHLGPVLRLTRDGDPALGARIAEHAAATAGASGQAYLSGDLGAALTLPGVRYGWLSIARISARAMTRVFLLALVGHALLALLERVPDLGSLICPEHARRAIEGGLGERLSSALPAYETSPQDLLSLLLCDGFIARG